MLLLLLNAFLVLESLLVVGFELVLMMRALTAWRASLREPRWRWLKWGLSVSPAAFLLLRPWFLQTAWTQVPGVQSLGMWVSLMAAVPVLALPALAACWWCLPPHDTHRFPILRAIGVACLIALLNYVPLLWFMRLR